MATIGFLTRQDVRQVAPTKQAFDPKRLWEIGLQGVHRMNPEARCRHMPPGGSNRPDLYILGEAPSEQQDRAGEPFIAGHWVDRFFSSFRVRFNNLVRTLPPLRGKGRARNRKPIPHEVECYRPSLIEDIEKTKPRAILGCGGSVYYWAFGLQDQIESVRGRRFAARFGSHECWFYPVLHPAYVDRCVESKGMVKYGLGDQMVPGREIGTITDRDLRRIAKDLRSDLEPPVTDDVASLFDGVDTEAQSAAKVLAFLKSCLDDSCVGIDLECNGLRPYLPGFRVLTAAVAKKGQSLAFPIDHPQSRWSKQDRAAILKAFHELCLASVRKTVHNLSYDLEVLVWLFNDPLILNSWWECSQRQAYVLDERKGCQSLNSLVQLNFGFKIKSITEVDRMNLMATELSKVLEYNGLDAKYHRRLFLRQRRTLEETGLLPVYDMHVKRIPSMVMAQRTGMPVDHQEVVAQRKAMEIKIEDTAKEIDRLDVVRKYCDRFGTFSPGNTDHVARLFRDVLGRKEGERDGGKYSTDEEVLSSMKDVPAAGLILQMRKWAKLKSTYIDPLDKTNPNTVVYPDGRLHPQFKDTGTDTGRISCEDPNAQNFPKRKNVEIRKMIAAICEEIEKLYGLGPLVLVATDYGQIEFRVIGMASKDKVIVDSCWTGYDVHADWAKKVIKAYDGTFKRRYGHMTDEAKAFKSFRNDIKNQFVFPFFFGAGFPSIANNLEMEERKLRPLYDQAKKTFTGVLRWQGEVQREYERTGAVANLYGRLRHGPMSKNMIINSPIQGTAADMNVNAWNRLREKALDEGKPWLAPIAQIHDDLTFLVPISRLKSSISAIVRSMCEIPQKWAHIVPITAEVSVGKNWMEMKEVGRFDSNKLDDQLEAFKRVA